MDSRIVSRISKFKTPWFELLAKTMAGVEEPFYSLRMGDYVSTVAFTEKKELLLVRQFRPAVERFTLELPSGHLEAGEEPIDAARRELLEECGYSGASFELLGKLASDTGRHENSLWCFFAGVVSVKSSVPEAGIERVLVPAQEIPEMIKSNRLEQAMDVAAVLLAMLKEGPALLGMK